MTNSYWNRVNILITILIDAIKINYVFSGKHVKEIEVNYIKGKTHQHERERDNAPDE